MIDILIHADPTWTDEAKQQLCFDVCQTFGAIPEMYPYMQAHSTPNGDVRLIIGEGFGRQIIELEGIIINATRTDI